jgi:probable F420-dependent oxidoreductase
MRIGFTLPQFAPLAHQPDQVARFARQVEEQIGADSLWVGDRLLAPVNPTVGYGGGTTIPAQFNAILDPFSLLTVAATVTERVELGTNVLNAPWYPPALLARSLTTIDVLSAGRLLLGFGIGWSPEEYQAVGVPMNERGARLDECLDALDALWTTDPAEYRGKYWTVPLTRAELKPTRKSGPPIYLAGFAPVAQRRIARRADGWLPVHRPGTRPFDPDKAITAPLAALRGLAVENGRDPNELRTVLRVYPVEGVGVDECAETLRLAEQDTEVDHAFVDLQCIAENVDHALELAERILDGARRH